MKPVKIGARKIPAFWMEAVMPYAVPNIWVNVKMMNGKKKKNSLK
jgi:hypothetical protein